MSPPILFAAVADDDTGASDLAGMLATAGVPTVLVIDSPSPERLRALTRTRSAVVLATASRAMPPRQAYDVTAGAVRLAAALNPSMLQVKYCSTFDSTAEGNIGPSIDAAMDVTGVPFTIALPALPVNGRTTYCGYHFVNGELLSESPMRHHPLNPMTDSNLLRLLSTQTERRIGSTPYPVVEEGADAVRSHWRRQQKDGLHISVMDCLSERHLWAIMEAAWDLRLVTGGSAFGSGLPGAWRRHKVLEVAPAQSLGGLPVATGRGKLVVAGSCSVATAAQNEWFARSGAAVVNVDPVALLEGAAGDAAARAIDGLASPGAVLVRMRSGEESRSGTREWRERRSLTAGAFGLQLSAAFARLARDIVEQGRPETLVVAGGETSSAVCRALGFGALAVGPNIQPGVPLCVPLEGRAMPVVLKSGNFGSEDFYSLAFDAAAKLPRT